MPRRPKPSDPRIYAEPDPTERATLTVAEFEAQYGPLPPDERDGAAAVHIATRDGVLVMVRVEMLPVRPRQAGWDAV